MPNRMAPRLPSPISSFFADRFRVFDRYSPPTTAYIRVLVFALVLLVLAVETDPVSAQAPETAPESEVGPLVTDRPTDSASPLLADRSVFSESSTAHCSRARVATIGTISSSEAPCCCRADCRSIFAVASDWSTTSPTGWLVQAWPSGCRTRFAILAVQGTQPQSGRGE